MENINVDDLLILRDKTGGKVLQITHLPIGENEMMACDTNGINYSLKCNYVGNKLFSNHDFDYYYKGKKLPRLANSAKMRKKFGINSASEISPKKLKAIQKGIDKSKKEEMELTL